MKVISSEGKMINAKTVLVLLVFVGTCYGQVDKYYKKKHHHHHYGLHHHHFLYYLTFLAIKLKIVFFLGTIFTIGVVAAKVVAILKLTEYMKHKYHHEEKIVYVNPHEHHDYGGFVGHSGPSDFVSSKAYAPYPPDVTFDQPPSDAYAPNDHYVTDSDSIHYGNGPPSERSAKEGFTNEVYEHFSRIADRIRQLNITDMTLNEMGIKDEHCKKKFVCQADYNAKRNIILKTGFNILKDVSYEIYKPNSTITSEEECETLYQQCNNNHND